MTDLGLNTRTFIKSLKRVGNIMSPTRFKLKFHYRHLYAVEQCIYIKPQAREVRIYSYFSRQIGSYLKMFYQKAIGLIFAPSLDIDILYLCSTECIDKCTRKACISDKRHVEVDGCTAYLITIGKL